MAGVALEGVDKIFDGDVVALDDVSFEARDGEFLVLLGPSGCGKSTALRMIAGLDEPTRGAVRIGDEVVNGREPVDRDVAMVFQSYALYPHKSVRDNIEFPLKPRGIDKAERKRMVAEVAATLGLTELLDRRPKALSGGQRQRVALARAMVRRPSVFLMDEPLSNLDAKLRTQTRADLVALHDRVGITFVYVTHDQVEAMTMADRVVVLDRGRVQQVGPPQEVYERPANLFVARFLGGPPMTTLQGSAEDETTVRVAGGRWAMAPLPVRPGAPYVVGVRPEHLRLSPSTGDDGVPALVRAVESLGHERLVFCTVATGSVDGELGQDATAIVRQSAEAPIPSVGDAVRLTTGADHLHLFEPESGERVEA